ncbi:peptide/nickel transport system permease protein [Mesorhizobium sp. J18]|uniref:ABC transporter permease n=1 Tax=Mesorhizobium sp. J18 TaxID=935263 RepID=UPI00119A3F00|nr:ABC transporter permease [Mesorhizobium sp. J18]TWG94239.1 peptide/nickel transport system permease protein [Mesorhizobium sp. J18]
MALYVINRLLAVMVVLLVISMLVFGVTQIMPGDVASTIAGQFASPEVVDAIREKLGLNDPFYVQYWRWISSVVTGDFGQSLIMERPVSALISEAFMASASLAIVSFISVTLFGILLGVWAAVRRDKLADNLVSTFTYVGISIPEFFWGIVLIMFFANYLQILPSGGVASISASPGVWLSHIILPVITLTLTLIAHVSRLTRSSMLEALDSQYVRNARAKGLPERTVIFRHALPNALMPTITVLALDVGWLIGGIVVVEVVFSYPGIGRLLMFAIERHDLPLIQASILVIALIYCLANLVADLLYAVVNPKIRYGNGE